MMYPLYYSWKLAVLWGPQGSPLYKRRCRIVARYHSTGVLRPAWRRGAMRCHCLRPDKQHGE